MSKSEDGAIVGRIIKGAIALIGTVVLGIFSVKKGKEKYDDWGKNRNA